MEVYLLHHPIGLLMDSAVNGKIFFVYMCTVLLAAGFYAHLIGKPATRCFRAGVKKLQSKLSCICQSVCCACCVRCATKPGPGVEPGDVCDAQQSVKKPEPFAEVGRVDETQERQLLHGETAQIEVIA